ncbi:MAG: LysE family transporter [Spirochaetes bacterium]|nr:LysE family transporter [Spirochaetota bacterium]
MNWIPFLSYVFITTFTPGPNNIMSTAVGLQYGYRKALSFISGIFLVFLAIMLACSFFVDQIYHYFPGFEKPLKFFGAGYILFLAFKVLTAKENKKDRSKQNLSFKEGLLMQFSNPKVIIYGITVTSSFIVPVVKNPFLLILASFFLAATSFCSTSTWAIAGSLFSRYLSNPKIRTIFNVLMALLLVYCALSIIGWL